MITEDPYTFTNREPDNSTQAFIVPWVQIHTSTRRYHFSDARDMKETKKKNLVGIAATEIKHGQFVTVVFTACKTSSFEEWYDEGTEITVDVEINVVHRRLGARLTIGEVVRGPGELSINQSERGSHVQQEGLNQDGVAVSDVRWVGLSLWVSYDGWRRRESQRGDPPRVGDAVPWVTFTPFVTRGDIPTTECTAVVSSEENAIQDPRLLIRTSWILFYDVDSFVSVFFRDDGLNSLKPETAHDVRLAGNELGTHRGFEVLMRDSVFSSEVVLTGIKILLMTMSDASSALLYVEMMMTE